MIDSLSRLAADIVGRLRSAPPAVRWGIVAGVAALAYVVYTGYGWGPTASSRELAATATPAAQAAEGEFLIRSYDEITNAGSPPTAVDVTSEIGLDLILKLAIVVGLIYAGAFVLRKMGFAGSGPVVGERRIRVLESQALGPQRSISIVEVGGRQFLVGMTPQQIQLLAELNDAPASATTATSVRSETDGAGSSSSRRGSRPANQSLRLQTAARSLSAARSRLEEG